MSNNPSTGLKKPNPHTPIYLGGIFTSLFALDAVIFVYRDQSQPALETRIAAATLALASLFLMGLTAVNLRHVGKGSVMNGLRNTLFRPFNKNTLTSSQTTYPEKIANLNYR
jgi:hypothetical protein